MANFTQTEINMILSTFDNILSRLEADKVTVKDPNDKPYADGYAMMASLLQNRLNNDSSLSPADRQELTNVMHWFEGAEKVNRGEGSFSAMIRTYSDTQGELRYNHSFGADKMQEASNKIGLNAFDEIKKLAGSDGTNPVPLLDMQFIAEKDVSP